MAPATLDALSSPTAPTARNRVSPAKNPTTGHIIEPLKGQALLDALAGYVGSFEGPGDLSERHSEYFTEALIAKFERKRKRNS